MLTPEDIKNLTEFQKTVFATKEEMNAGFESLNKKLSNLQTSVDAIAKDNLTKSQEMPVVNNRIEKVENWIDKAAPKVGIKFQH
jgi:predicted  nucleic acid-binding Zn-ribbon protein